MEVRLFAHLRENRSKVIDVEHCAGMDGCALLKELDIKPETVSIFLINGVSSRHDTILKHDDVVALFPPIGGG